jgi:putative transposase
MTRAYSEDLRIRVVRDVEAGASRRSVALKYAVSVSFVIKLVQRWRTVGTVAPRGTGGRKVHALMAHAELVDRLLASKRDITLDELRRGLLDEGVLIGCSSIDRYLKAQGLTRKKRQRMLPSRSAPTLPPHVPSGAKSSLL